MSLEEICRHERLEMAFHSLEQHNWHVWAWLNYHLTLWFDANPIRVRA